MNTPGIIKVISLKQKARNRLPVGSEPYVIYV